jgi:VCBS repeat protein
VKREPLFVVFISVFLHIFPVPVLAQVTFFQPPTYSGTFSGSTGPAVFVADFDGDGKPDILTSDGTLNLGNGDATFTLGVSVSGPVLAVGDFNGDHKPDIFEQGTGTLLVLLGNGNGTFQSPISTLTGANLSPIEVVDLRGNGLADVIGIFNNNLLVYLSKGDGTFALQVSHNLGTSSAILSSGDFNGDGKQDVVCSVAGQEITFLGNGDGTFQAPVTSPGIAFPNSVAVADFSGDGKLDLAITGNSSLGILVSQGNGKFVLTTTTPVPGGVLVSADLTGNGKQDLLIWGSAAVYVYLGNGDGTFSNVSNYIIFGQVSNAGVAVADFNLDQKPDIATSGSVLLGNGNGTFQGIQLGLVDPAAIAGASAVLGKFEKNGSTDAAYLVPGVSSSTLSILHNDGQGLLFVAHTYTFSQPTISNSSTTLAVGLTGNGNLDLIVGGDNGYSVLLGNGDGTFQPPLFSNIGAVFSMVVGDVNNDHKPDLILQPGSSAATGSSALVLLGNGDGTFKSPVSYFDAGLSTLVVADFNGDGNPDIAAGGLISNSAQTGILFGNGDGTFQNIVFPASLNGFAALFTADFNTDGKPDLLSGSSVALGNGDGTFTILSSFSSDPPSSANGIADFNGDGILDLFVLVLGGFHGPIGSGILLGKGDGSFDPLINIPDPAGTLVKFPLSTALISDMNGDGLPDLVFPYWISWGGALPLGVGVLINTTHTGPPDFTVGPASGSPTSQTVSVGQKASFSLMLAPMGSSSPGMVNLTCAVTPVVTASPTCTLSSSSINLTGAPQTVTVNVQTVGPMTSGMVSYGNFPPAAMPLTWCLTLLISLWLWARSRRRLPLWAAPLIVLAMALWVGCGGGSSTNSSMGGTPSGTYTATVTATSGSLSHNIALQVIVH